MNQRWMTKAQMSINERFQWLTAGKDVYELVEQDEKGIIRIAVVAPAFARPGFSCIVGAGATEVRKHFDTVKEAQECAMDIASLRRLRGSGS